MAFAPKALASGKLWQQCAGSHRIAASTAPLSLAVGSSVASCIDTHA
jgi:hypothetical protein